MVVVKLKLGGGDVLLGDRHTGRVEDDEAVAGSFGRFGRGAVRGTSQWGLWAQGSCRMRR